MMWRMARGPWFSRISGRWYLASMELVMAPADSSAGDSDLPWLLTLSWRSKSESMASSLAFWNWALRPWAGKEGEMEFGGVGRSRDRVTVIAGSLRAATAVKLSRLKEAWGISRAAVAKEAMFSFIPELQEMLRSSKSAARDAALVSICTFALEKKAGACKQKGIPP